MDQPVDAYNEVKAARDLAAREEHRLLHSSLTERVEAMLMSNVLKDAERRPMRDGIGNGQDLPGGHLSVHPLRARGHREELCQRQRAHRGKGRSAGQELEALGWLLCDALGRGYPTSRDERGYFEARALGKCAQTKAGRVAKALAAAEKQAAGELRNALKPKSDPEKEAARIAALQGRLKELAAEAADSARSAAVRAEPYAVDEGEWVVTSVVVWVSPQFSFR